MNFNKTNSSCVSTLESINLQEFTKLSTMVSTCGKGGHGNREEHGSQGCLYCYYRKKIGHTQDNWYSWYGFPNNRVNISKSETIESKFSDKEYQEYLRLKFRSIAQASTNPNLTTQFVKDSSKYFRSYLPTLGIGSKVSS